MAKLLKEASIMDQNGNVSPTPESSPNNTDDDGVVKTFDVTPPMCVIISNLAASRTRLVALHGRLEELIVKCERGAEQRSLLEAFDEASQRAVETVLSVQRKVRGDLLDAFNNTTRVLIADAIENGVREDQQLTTSGNVKSLDSALYEYLDHQLDSLTSQLPPALFKAILRAVFVGVVKNVRETALQLNLSPEQVQRASMLLRSMSEYFHADGQGVAKASIDAQTALLSQLLELYNEASRLLIDFYTNLATKRRAIQEQIKQEQTKLETAPAQAAAERRASVLELSRKSAARRQSSETSINNNNNNSVKNDDNEDDIDEDSSSSSSSLSEKLLVDDPDAVVERIASLKRKIENLSECAECVHRILAARVDDKAAQAFCASAATGPLDDHQSTVRLRFGLPDFEFVLSEYKCSWGTTLGTLYLTSFSLCFYSTTTKFVVALKDIVKIEKRRFTMVQLRVYVMHEETPKDLSTVSRTQLMTDIIAQAGECGHQIQH